MMVIDTPRLRIMALTPEQFGLLLNRDKNLEKETGILFTIDYWDNGTFEAMRILYAEASSRPQEYLWYTSWHFLLKKENRSIGSFCFKGSPDKNGEVEIGYGTDPQYRGKGYASEAVSALCRWAFRQKGVRHIMAETEKTNRASNRILEKCSMQPYDESGEIIRWKLTAGMAVKIRPETPEDEKEIYLLIKRAFETADVKDGDEHDYAFGLKKSAKYIPELSLIAEIEGKPAGHIMLTRTSLTTSNGVEEVLLLSPLSVLLEYRNRGIGKMLITKSLDRAREMGFQAVFLCGNPNYYQRMGFRKAAAYGIKSRDPIPEDFVLALELTAGSLANRSGIVECC